MRQTMMKLGAFTFSVDTAAYQSLSRESSWRWPEFERPGKLPARQFLGPNADRVSLPGVIYPHFAGGLGQLDAMRGEAGEGVPLLLVDGTGAIRGYWCIERVRETQRSFLPGGVPRRVDFTLELVYWGRTAQ